MKFLYLLVALALCNVICCQSFLGHKQNSPVTPPFSILLKSLTSNQQLNQGNSKLESGSRLLSGAFSSLIKQTLPVKLLKENNTVSEISENDESDIAMASDSEVSTPDEIEASELAEATDDGALVWDEIPLEQAQANPVTTANFAFGLQYATGQGIQSALLSNVNYNTNRVFKVLEATNGTEISTQVDCEILGNETNAIPVNVTVVVHYDNQTKSRKMVGFSLNYQPTSTDNIVYNIAINWSATYETYEVIITPVDPSQAQPTDSTLNITEWLGVNDFTQVTVDEFNNNQTLSTLLQRGAQYIIDNTQGTDLPTGGNYTIADVYGVYQQHYYPEVNFFVFDILIGDELGNKARVNYEISFILSSGASALENYAFNYIQNVPVQTQ